MPQNWIRKCSLIVADEKGEGLELSSFRCTFSISWPGTRRPNSTTGVAGVIMEQVSRFPFFALKSACAEFSGCTFLRRGERI